MTDSPFLSYNYSTAGIEASEITDFAVKNDNVYYLVEENGNMIWVNGDQLKAPIQLIETFFIQYIDRVEQTRSKAKRSRQ